MQHGHQGRPGALLARRRPIDVADVVAGTRASTGCGTCRDAVEGIVGWLRARGGRSADEQAGRRRQRHGRPPAGRDAARPRPARPVEITVLAEEARPAYDRVRLVGVVRRRAARSVRVWTVSTCGWASRRSRSIGRGARWSTARRRVRVRRPGAGHRLVPVRAAGAGHGPAGLLRLPHHRRPRRARRLRQRPRAPASSSAAGCSAWRRPTRCAGSGLSTHVVEFAPRLMPLQVDEAGGAMLRRHIEDLGLDRPHRTDAAAGRAAATARSAGLCSPTAACSAPTWWSSPPACGPRDELARAAGLAVGARGGIVVDDAVPDRRPGTSTRSASAPRSAAAVYGLVAPGYAMAEVVADRLLGGDGDVPRRRHVDQAEAARRGRGLRSATHRTPGRWTSTFTDPATRRLRQAGALRRRADAARRDPGRRRRGVRARCGPCVGAAAARRRRWRCCAPAGGRRRRRTLPGDGAGLLLQRRHQGRRIVSAITEQGCTDVAAVKACTRAGTTCGSLRAAAQAAARPSPAWRMSQGAVRALRPQPARAVRHRPGARHHAPSPQLIAEHGTGRGCDICKPAVASILASHRRRLHPRRRAGRAAGHQRPLPGQHPAQRHLLGGAAHPRRRDHARRS